MERPLQTTLIAALLCPSLLLLAEPLDWIDTPPYRVASLKVPASGKTGFAEISPNASGIEFINRLAARTSITNQIYLNGSGIAAADVNGDDLCDLYFCGLESNNQLYLNRGNWRFELDSDAGAILCSDQASTGAAFADLDGDSDPDLLVNGIRQGTRLFLNNGQGQFSEATDAWGLRNQRGSTSLTYADVNGDGWLDLYVVNYRNETMRDEPDSPFDVRIRDGQYELVSYRDRPGTDPDLIGRFSFDRNAGVMENGEADQLFLNSGGGTFQTVGWDEGIFVSHDGTPAPTPYDWGLSAMFRDLNGDGWPDLYVCNDFQSPDRIWINDGAGTFQPIRDQAIRQTSLFSMGLDIADLDRDGRDEIFVVDMLSRKHADRHIQVMDGMAFAQYRSSTQARPQSPRNTLLHPMPNGDYRELARLAGIDSSYWSWCPAFIDVDLDGYEDLLVTTGHGRDAQNIDISREIDQIIQAQSLPPAKQLELRQRYPALQSPNVAFRNGGGLSFDEVGRQWGFNSERISHGLALADLDNDGDQDVIASCLNAPPLILRNESSRPRLRVRLKGASPNTQGIGAKITVTQDGLPNQHQEIVGGGRYLSSDDTSRTFAMKNSSSAATVLVRWANGTQTRLTDIRSNQLLEIAETFSVTPPEFHDPTPNSSPLFRHDGDALSHRHVDQTYEDANQQRGLPRKLSEAGPGASWFDFNGDGWEDLFVGAGRGGRIGVFRNTGKGSFIKQKAKAFETPVRRDQATILGWQPDSQDRVLLIGQTNYEDPQARGQALRQFSVVTGKSQDNAIQTRGSIGPSAMADIDGDGDLDLFVGGSQLPGSYPHAPESFLLQNEANQLKDATEEFGLPKNLGMVRSAILADLSGDHHPELVVVGDWMAPRLFRNTGGHFTEWDPPVHPPAIDGNLPKPTLLSRLRGYWNSVETGDFDNDGRLDLVAGNAGHNQTTWPHSEGRRRLYFSQAARPGTGLIAAYFNSALDDWFPLNDRASLIAQFPRLEQATKSFTTFGSMSISDLGTLGLPDLTHTGAHFTTSIVLLNRGEHLVMIPLPVEAQFAPVYGLGVRDFDLDGSVDLILNQNVFTTTETAGRQDAGSLVFLRGLGNGHFTPLPSPESGLTGYGQGRGLAVCDFNHDGRPDFVTTEHNGLTRAFRNQTPAKGLRVRLRGRGGNLQAVGSSVRLHTKLHTKSQRHHPRLTVSQGSGYQSQHGATITLPSPTSPAELEILWPNGKTEQVALPPNSREFSRSMP